MLSKITFKKFCKTVTSLNAFTEEEEVEVSWFPNKDKWAEEQFSKYDESSGLLENTLEADARILTEYWDGRGCY
jgi:hypothetical protein